MAEDERDLADPNNWGNAVESSLADLELPPPDEPEPEPPAPPAPDETASLRQQLADEQARRIRAQVEMEQFQSQRNAPPPAQPAPQDYTEEQLNELYNQSPARAGALLATRITDARVENIDTRMRTMLEASSRIVESQVATRFSDDFEAYGDEIRKVMQQVSPEHRIDPSSWENAVKYVRGTHMDEIIERKVKAQLEQQAATARATQARAAGFSGASRAGGGSAPSSSTKADTFHGLSEEQRRAADAIGVTYKDFAKHV